MAFLGTKLRGDIRRQIRRLGEMGELRFVEYASVNDVPSGLFELFMEAHRLKWPHAYKAPHFHERLVAACGLNGPIHFSAMMLDDTPIAWHMGFEWQGVYYYYMPAGNPDYLKQSPVKLHLYHLILRAIERGYTLYDHLRCDETYKSGWSDGLQYVNNKTIHSGSVPSKIKHGFLKLKALIR
jgi:CelD/BcsL family acetyltransferase involved in cellulose biosynthesis